MGNGAAAGADLDHLHGLDFERQPAATAELGSVRHFQLRRDARMAAQQHAQLGGGAAHVEGHQIAVAALPGILARRDHACGGPGLDHADRQRTGGDAWHDAAGRRHPKELPGFAPGQLALELRHVTRHQRPCVGVDRRGGCAVVLADFRAHAGRQRHADAGQVLAQQRADALLVPGVAVAVQQAHRDRPDPARLDGVGNLLHALLVQRHQHVAVHRHPLDRTEAVHARYQRFRELQLQVIQVVAALGADAQDVLETIRGDQRRRRAAAFQHRVGDHRGRAEDRGHVAAPSLAHLQQLVDALQHRAGRVVGRAQYLVGMHDPGIVEQCQVGERAAGIESEFHRGPLDKSMEC